MGVQLWDVATARQVSPTLSHRNWVPALAFSPDGQTLLTGSGDRRAAVWAVPIGARVAPVLSHLSGVAHAAYTPDGRLFATAQEDGLVRLWRPSGGAPGDLRIPGGTPGGQTYAVLSRDGAYVLPVSVPRRPQGLVLPGRVYETATGRAAGPALHPAGPLNGAAFAPDASRVVTVCAVPAPGLDTRAGRVQFWDWRAGTEVFPSLATPSEALTVAYSPDGKRLAVLCAEGQLLLIDPANGQVEARLEHGAFYQSPPVSPLSLLRFAPDGRTVAACGTSDGATVWDVAAGKARHASLLHKGLCSAVDFSADGRYLATASYDNTARVWDLQTGQPACAPLAHPDWVFQARFSADGRRLLTACRDYSARVWDWRAGRLTVPALAHQDEVFDACFSPDGQWILTASRDYTARVWAVASGKPITPPLALRGIGTHGLLTPDGRRAVVAGNAAHVSVFDLGDLYDSPGPRLSGDDLRVLGELIAGQALHPGGGAVNLTSAEWLDRWQRFRSAHPAFHKLRPGP